MKRGIVFLVTILFGACALCGTESQNRYIAWGATSPDQTWTGTDYLAFGRMMQGESGQLPTYADADGKAVLDRAFNLENFALYHENERPLLGRLQSLTQVQLGLKSAFAAYANAANVKDAKVSREASECLAMLLRSNPVLLDLMDESLVMAPTGGTAVAEQDEGVRQIQAGVLQLVDGAEASLSERNFYSDAERSSVLQALSDTLPRIRPLLSEQQVAIFRDRLQKRVPQFPAEKDTHRLAAMLEVLGAPLSHPTPH